jgi:predicted Zn-dependent protease
VGRVGEVSQSELLEAGDRVYQQMVAQGLLVSDSPYAPILDSVGERIAGAAALQNFAERFYIIIGNQMNAFSAPDGRVYVNEGLLRQVDNVDELANVLAHESAHLVLGHIAEQMRTAKGKDLLERWLGGVAPQVTVPGGGPAPLNVMGLVDNYSFLNFTRQQEFAADEKGAQIAAKAGFNPWGTVWFFKEVYRLYGDAGYESYVQKHPTISERIQKIQDFLNGEPAEFGRFSSVMPPDIGLPIGYDGARRGAHA